MRLTTCWTRSLFRKFRRDWAVWRQRSHPKTPNRPTIEYGRTCSEFQHLTLWKITNPFPLAHIGDGWWESICMRILELPWYLYTSQHWLRLLLESLWKWWGVSILHYAVLYTEPDWASQRLAYALEHRGVTAYRFIHLEPYLVELFCVSDVTSINHSTTLISQRSTWKWK